MPFKPVEHPKCPKCGKSVYAAEEMSAGGYKWHKFCFKCSMCNKLLDSMSCCEHQAQLFCKQCHCRRYGPKGVGFGIGAGSLTMDTGEQFGNTEVDMTLVSKRFHVQCYMCNKLLDSCTVAPHEAELYCKQCHGRKFGPKGVGFGLGAGCLTTDSGEKFGGSKQTNRPMTAEAFTAPINPSHS
ncbi:CRE-MLP-1 protein [Caenorhabditis remanei]|uniref:Cysteine-rich protein 1 n=1 Tax=Caenorhabditis remanei TaxID=31234 RepID=E3LYP7_CAERE|nr:CRE-MLP-1 protein [Caenorhabditis remanei]